MKKNRKFSANANQIVWFGPRKQPFPPRWKGKFVTGFFGQIPTGATPVEGYWAFLNSPVLPFTATTSIIPIGNQFPGPILPGGATLSTLNPLGFTQLCGVTSPYSQYRVYASSIQFEIMQTDTSADSVMDVVVVPANLDDAAYLSYADAVEAPFAKSRFSNVYQGNRIIRNSISVSKLTGIASKAIEYDLSGRFGYVNSLSQPNFPLIWQVLTSAITLTAPVDYKITITYKVELMSVEGQALSFM